MEASLHSGRPALIFNTLSEPTAKSLRYLSQFDFADRAKLEGAVRFSDLGGVEADEVSPFDEGDPAFVYEPADVAGVDPQGFGELGDVEQFGKR